MRDKNRIQSQAIYQPIQGFTLCPILCIHMPPTLQMLGIPFKVNTVLNSVFNMFSVMGCLVIGVYALALGSRGV